MTTTTPLTFTWRIEYSDDQGKTWQPATSPDASGTVVQDEGVPERCNIFQVACTQADIYADAHRAGHPGRQWQARVDDGVGHSLGVVANES
jgi:hypothetical protein